jgi:hypothetical protein
MLYRYLLLLLACSSVSLLRAETRSATTTRAIEGMYTYGGDSPAATGENSQLVFTATEGKGPKRILLPLASTNKVLQRGESYRIVASVASEKGAAEAVARQILVYLPQGHGVEYPFLLNSADSSLLFPPAEGGISYLKMDLPSIVIL